MLNKEDRKYFLNEFLRNIQGISDKDYQQKIWICAEGPECDDFDETVCYFSENVDSILDNYADYGITEIQSLLLKKFRKAFEAFADENDWPPFFIESPEWKKITEMAKDVLAAFNYERKGV